MHRTFKIKYKTTKELARRLVSESDLPENAHNNSGFLAILIESLNNLAGDRACSSYLNPSYSYTDEIGMECYVDEVKHIGLQETDIFFERAISETAIYFKRYREGTLHSPEEW